MYLGLDLGTSGVKALLIDDNQTILASGNGALDVSRPHFRLVGAGPGPLAARHREAVAAIKASHPEALASVKGIGLSGQMHGATLVWTRPAMCCAPASSGMTRVPSRRAAKLDADPRFPRHHRQHRLPGFTAPKLVWVKNNEPEIFAKVAKVLLPKDYLRLWLTGEYLSEMSDSAGTSWLDTGKRAWSPELWPPPISMKATCRVSSKARLKAGVLRAELLAEWGMTGRVVVAGGAGDNAPRRWAWARFIRVRPSCRSAPPACFFAANDRYLPNPASAVHAFCHAIPNTWHQMGVILSRRPMR